MTVRARPIRSCADGDCPRPFVEYTDFKVKPGGIELAIARCSGPAASAECKTVDAAKERALEKVWSFTYDLTAPTELHVLALRLDGQLEFVPQSKQQPVYYAHLAFVDPVSGDADVLAFVDEDEHKVAAADPAAEEPAP